MAKNKFYSDYDRSTVITILICMTVIAVGCVLGIAYLLQYGFYNSGDNGSTAKSIAVQQYTLDDIEQARDYYSCLIETNDEYRINYYKTKFSPSQTNFVFSITDIGGKTLFSNYASDPAVPEAVYEGRASVGFLPEDGICAQGLSSCAMELAGLSPQRIVWKTGGQSHCAAAFLQYLRQSGGNIT